MILRNSTKSIPRQLIGFILKIYRGLLRDRTTTSKLQESVMISSRPSPSKVRRSALHDDWNACKTVTSDRAYKGPRLLYAVSSMTDQTSLYERSSRCKGVPMQLGYSTLLIHDHIIADYMAHPQATAFDLTMMGVLAGKERKEENWQGFLASARFKIIEIWTSTPANQSIIQAEWET